MHSATVAALILTQCHTCTIKGDPASRAEVSKTCHPSKVTLQRLVRRRHPLQARAQGKRNTCSCQILLVLKPQRNHTHTHATKVFRKQTEKTKPWRRDLHPDVLFEATRKNTSTHRERQRETSARRRGADLRRLRAPGTAVQLRRAPVSVFKYTAHHLPSTRLRQC